MTSWWTNLSDSFKAAWLIVGGVGATTAITAMGVGAKLATMQEQINATMEDRFTMTMAAEQALRTAMENPGLRVPDPRNPSNYFQVRSGE